MDYNCTIVDIFNICEKDGVIIFGNNQTTSGFSTPNYPQNITLPSTFEEREITEVGFKAFSTTRVKNVVLGKYIIFIHQSAFRHCIELESITIPPTVKYIGEGGIRKANTEGKVNESSLFVFFLPNSQLQYLDGASVSGATSIKIVFCGCAAPKFISNSAFKQATDLKIITPAPMKLSGTRAIFRPNECYIYPVYNKYSCMCQATCRRMKSHISFITALIILICIQ